ncbi:PREDICTED: uncharacterized protein LOC107336622 isoform X1 [Acropora digitifera]|uniref:uncharacterized protein LOC107336622 isoform X1 n=1 Tax=Acropora digitifera TaxID=70779 RepID=UPI00077A7D7E|nr:PREDICTED: uncharacterized protein LOC107336622 isoform X1 [Acropora digitifera]
MQNDLPYANQLPFSFVRKWKTRGKGNKITETPMEEITSEEVNNKAGSCADFFSRLRLGENQSCEFYAKEYGQGFYFFNRQQHHANVKRKRWSIYGRGATKKTQVLGKISDNI